ncbi:MAG: hypothetical protein CBD08_007710 [Cellvibrionales bacterium TMED148]|nr:MAG: hypothetical protein CBD08_007710 [Cellvibrionales bacterium TMED148]
MTQIYKYSLHVLMVDIKLSEGFDSELLTSGRGQTKRSACEAIKMLFMWTTHLIRYGLYP